MSVHEIDQMYPVYLNTAQYQEEKGAERSFHFALEAEKIHARLFQDAQDTAKSGKDISSETVMSARFAVIRFWMKPRINARSAGQRKRCM